MSEKQKVTRRRLLQAAATAVAVPYVLPSAVWAAQGDAAPNNRINAGCIGLGGMGNGDMDRLLNARDVQVVAVCDLDTGARENAKRKVENRYANEMKQGTYKGCAAYHDFRDLVARDDIDLVQIAVPDHWHAILAIAACKAGKDVYCEKPLALTIREARAMVNAARRYGRVFQTGSQQRSEANFRFACELVRNHYIGDLIEVHVNVGGPSVDGYLPEEPVPAGFDYDFWLGPAPWRPFNRRYHPYNWRDFRDFSGGQMTDWGAHHFDIAQWGIGMDHSGPVEIHPPDGKDVQMLTYIYANGVKMYHDQTHGVNGVLFVGPKGKVEVNRGYLRTWPDTLKDVQIGPNEIHLYKTRGHNMDDLLQCIRTRSKPVCDVEIGCRSVSVCHLGNIAYWLKRSLKWDPEKEEIIGDPDAARWLDRPKRAPWYI